MIAPVKDKPPAATPPEDYFDAVHRKTWLQRSAGLLGGITIGIAFGAAIGLLSAFVPSLLVGVGLAEGAAAVTALAVAKTTAVFAAAGALMGFTAMAATGSDAGAISAGLQELDKRGKLGEGKALEQAPAKSPGFFSWKAAIITIPLGIGVGALLATAGIPLGPATLGFEAGSSAAVAASGAVFGMSGALFAMPFGHYTTKLSNFYSKVLTGKLFGEEAPAAAQPQPAQAREVAPVPEVVQDMAQEKPARRFASQRTRFSLQGMIEKTHEAGTDQPTHTR